MLFLCLDFPFFCLLAPKFVLEAAGRANSEDSSKGNSEIGEGEVEGGREAAELGDSFCDSGEEVRIAMGSGE